MGVCVRMTIASKEIELERPGCSGFEANFKSFPTSSQKSTLSIAQTDSEALAIFFQADTIHLEALAISGEILTSDVITYFPMPKQMNDKL